VDSELIDTQADRFDAPKSSLDLISRFLSEWDVSSLDVALQFIFCVEEFRDFEWLWIVDLYRLMIHRAVFRPASPPTSETAAAYRSS
jgi:hypothetical protein